MEEVRAEGTQINEISVDLNGKNQMISQRTRGGAAVGAAVCKAPKTWVQF